ncbi:MAG: aromatic amino acid transaminase [Lysobacterales bacterium]
MFENLEAIAPDPILGVLAAFLADDNPRKIDLGVGVYRDEAGDTPILECVRRAERVLLDTQTTKTYLGPAGVAGFNSAMSERLFGADSDALNSGRVRTIQTPGGTGALRLAADLIRAARPDSTVWASDPTWANHLALFPAAGLSMQAYPYFDAAQSRLRFDDMMESLSQRQPGDTVLFHACCHNPCGVSPSPEQWVQVADICADRGVLPLVDIAYMGFERGIEDDTLIIRLLAERCPEMIVASSCSKNFAMYRERVGAVSILSQSAAKTEDVVSVLNSLSRKNYSMPPAHGPAVIDIILHSDELSSLWEQEVAGMRERINGLRSDLAQRTRDAGLQRDFSFLEEQTGMFSFLGLSGEQVDRLADEFSIYTVRSSRINLASFNASNLDYFVDALGRVL